MTGLALGIDIGGTNTKVALVNRHGEVPTLETIPTEGGAPNRLIAPLISICDSVRAGKALDGVGIAVAGFLDGKRDRLLYNPNLAPLEGYPLLDRFRSRFEVPVHLEVDSNAACLAEARFGAGRNSRRFLSLAIGTGLGGGMTINGRLVRLTYECIGDIGHVIVAPGGPRCAAGCKGCAEALVSAGALEARMPGRSARQIIDAALRGDVHCIDLLAETGRFLGIALASMATILFPDCVAIAGGLSEAGELLLSPATKSFRENAARFLADRVTIRKAELGWKATVIGAAAALWDGPAVSHPPPKPP